MHRGTVEAIMWIGCTIAACIALNVTQSIKSVAFLIVPLIVRIVED